MDNFNWKAVTAVLVVLGWLMYQFTVDVSSANNRIASLKDYHDTDYAEIMESIDKGDDERRLMLEKLAANEESHKNIKQRLDRIDDKLDKIYDMVTEVRK
jgi:septal ring factor EnvC (AmiA/AmiB activator)